MRRIFVAIKISNELQNVIAQWQETSPNSFLVRNEMGERVRWTPGQNLHVTLVPPWPVNSALDLEEVVDRLRTVQSKSFTMHFERVGFGPDPKSPRLIWAEGKTFKEILDLRLRIYDSLGQQPQNKSFVLHTTLARFRPGDFKDFAVKDLNEKVNWKQKINSFVLMESLLTSNGARYEVLEDFGIG